MVLNRLNQFSRLIKNPRFGQKVPKWMRKQTKEMVLNSKPGWVRTKQNKVRYSSWLIESVNYGAEPIEPVSNWSIRLTKNLKFGQKVSKWIRKQTKETVLNSKPGWVRTKQSKVRCSSWLTESANYGAEPVEPVSNWSIRLNPKFGQKVPKWIRNQTKAMIINSEPGKVRTKQSKVRCSS